MYNHSKTSIFGEHDNMLDYLHLILDSDHGSDPEKQSLQGGQYNAKSDRKYSTKYVENRATRVSYAYEFYEFEESYLVAKKKQQRESKSHCDSDALRDIFSSFLAED